MSDTNRTPKWPDEHKTTLITMRYRDATRPAPWGVIADTLGVKGGSKRVATVLERLLWGMVTGYPGRDRHGAPPPPPVWAKPNYRSGLGWRKPEQDALREALEGEGQVRQPPVDIAYIAAVLGRTKSEVQAEWKRMNGDQLGRQGFF